MDRLWLRPRSITDNFARERALRQRNRFLRPAFEADANFTNARFYYPPDFDAVQNASRIDFTNALIGFSRRDAPRWKKYWTTDTQIPVRLRAIRKIVEETKNHDLERDLYIEERNAERGVYWHTQVDELNKQLEDINKQKRDAWSEWRLQARAHNTHRLRIAVKIARLSTHLLWIAVMGVYWALADYGRSFVRPLAWLIASVFFFDWRYTEVLTPFMAKAPDADKYKKALGMLALGNAAPFVGPLTIDTKIKELLACRPSRWKSFNS